MVRPLSKDLQQKAIEELHENPERVKEDIRHIQEWIKQQPHLNAPTDKQWILGFLRGSKFSLQKTKEKFDMYYAIKTVIPEWINTRTVYSIDNQAVLKAGITLPLPYTENYKGPKIMLIRFQNCDTSIMNIQNITTILYMILNILMVEDDNFIISGLLLWYDVSSLPSSIILQLTPTYIKNFANSMQNVLPLRIKGVHLTGSFAIVEKLLFLFKGHLGSKLKNRLFVYSDKNFENVYESVPKINMPKEYGGENSTVEEIRDYWINKVESYSTWFAENDKYCTNEAARPGKPLDLDIIVGGLIGANGSFRKLNVD